MSNRLILPFVFVAALLVYAAPLMGQQPPAQNPASPVTTVPGTVPEVAPGAPSQSAVAVTTVPSPASPQHVPEQIEWALACAYALQMAKKTGLIKPDVDAKVKAMIGGVVAVATAAGIHIGVSGSFFHGDGALTVTGLSFNAFKDIGFQWVAQQAWYDGLVKKVVAA